MSAPFNVQKILIGLGYEVHAYRGWFIGEATECVSIHSDDAQHDICIMMRVSDLIRDRYKLPVTKGLNIIIDQLGERHVIYFPDIPFEDEK